MEFAEENESWMEQFIDPDVHLYQVPEYIRLSASHQKHMCPICKTYFNQKQSLNRHHREKHERKETFTCLNCSRVFRRKEHLKIHDLRCNGGTSKYSHPSPPPTKKGRISDQERVHYEVGLSFHQIIPHLSTLENENHALSICWQNPLLVFIHQKKRWQ